MKNRKKKVVLQYNEDKTLLSDNGKIVFVKPEAIPAFLSAGGFRIELKILPTVGLSFALGALCGIIVCVLIVLFA